MLDEITRAVLSREEVSRYLDGTRGERGDDVRARIEAYVDELKTTQRYSIYKALKHPLYPILRKVDRIGEHVELVKNAVRGARVVYASNHRSHCDYLVEPLVLDDNGVRPPIIAAGINLFGGPLGLLHRHVTGAIPIRRNTRDPVYLITLKAYVAELLRKHDLFFYPEGGRSYNGALKSAKTGLMQAALQAEHPRLVLVPTAVSYDLVLEDHILARQGVKRTQRPFSRELAEMVRYAVGYRSRAYRHLRPADSARRRRCRVAPRRARPEPHGDEDDRTALQGAAAVADRGGDAALDHAARPRGARRRDCRYAARGRRQPRRVERRRSRRSRHPGARSARHRRGGARPGPRPRAERAALLRTRARPPAGVSVAPHALTAVRGARPPRAPGMT